MLVALTDPIEPAGEAILRAATQVFARNGYFNAKVADVARVAGVADGTVYIYFKSKEEILHSIFDRSVMGASLDHALWFHRPFRADDWLLYAQDSPNFSGARGFARGLIFTRDGTLVASVAQEGLLRERRQAR